MVLGAVVVTYRLRGGSASAAERTVATNPLLDPESWPPLAKVLVALVFAIVVAVIVFVPIGG